MSARRARKPAANQPAKNRSQSPHGSRGSVPEPPSSRLTSTDHVYSLTLGLIAANSTWRHQPWWLSLAELIVLIAASEGVLAIAGGLRHNLNDDPHFPITPRQVLAVIASVAVVVVLGGIFFNMR